MSKVIAARLSDEDAAAIERAAIGERRKPGQLLRMIAEDWVKQRERAEMLLERSVE